MFGAPPFPAVVAAALALVVGAIVLFVLGLWVVAIPLVLAGAALSALAVGGARRHPESRIVLFASRLARELRGRLWLAVEFVGAWSSANRTLFRLRREVRALLRQREAAVRALGAATYARDKAAAAEARETIASCEAAVAEREQAAAQVVAAAQRRFAAEQASMTPTETLTPRAAERLAQRAART